MATFDIDAARNAGVPEQQIQVYMQSNGLKPHRTIGGFLKNIGKSGINAIGGIASGVANIFNPNLEQNTVANLVRLPFDAGRWAAGDTNNNRAKQLVDYYGNRYGKDIGNTLYEDPLGVALDASTLLTGGGALLKGAGAASKAGELSQLGANLTRAGEFIDPVIQSTRGIGKAASYMRPDRTKIADFLEKNSNDIVTKGLGNPAKQADFLKRGKTTAGDIFERYNLYDRAPETAQAAKRQALNQYDELAMKSGNRASLAPLLQNIDNEIAAIQNGPGKYTDSGMSMIAELQRRKGQLLEYVGAADNATPLFDVGQLTQFRRALDSDIPKSQFALDAKGSGTAQGAKKMRDLLRETINSTDPRLERLGLDYGVLKGYEDVFNKAANRANNRQLIGIKNIMAGGIGNAMAGVPGMLGAAALEMASNNPRVLQSASKGLRGASEMVRGANVPKLPANVFKTLKVGYETGKGGRLANPQGLSRELTKTEPVQDVSPPTQAPQRQKSYISQPSVLYSKVKVSIPKKRKTNLAFSGPVKLTRSNAY